MSTLWAFFFENTTFAGALTGFAVGVGVLMGRRILSATRRVMREPESQALLVRLIVKQMPKLEDRFLPNWGHAGNLIPFTKRVSSEAGPLLKELRIKMGLTQGDLAQLLGTSVSFVSRLERGLAFLRFQKDIDALAELLKATGREKSKLRNLVRMPER